jgi:hypothetical protein
VTTLTLGHMKFEDEFTRFKFVTDVFMKIHALWEMTPFCLVVNNISDDLVAFIFRLREFG